MTFCHPFAGTDEESVSLRHNSITSVCLLELSANPRLLQRNCLRVTMSIVCKNPVSMPEQPTTRTKSGVGSIKDGAE